MLCKTIKKTGLYIIVFSLITIFFLTIYALMRDYIISLIEWIIVISQLRENISAYIVILSLIIIFSLGVFLWLLGEILEFIISNYPSILLEKKEYDLNVRDKSIIFVIIPAYNESVTIKKAIDSVRPYTKNIVVVDDGSTDDTGKIAEMNGAIVVKHKLNEGLGKSLLDGVKEALSLGAEYMIIFDADLQYDSKDIPSIMYYLIEEDYDLIMGSRFAGYIEKMTFIKKIGNKLYTRLLRFLTKTGISDGQTGLRGFTSEFIKKIRIRGDFTYTQEMILEAVMKKTKIGEIPINFYSRTIGQSRLMKNPFHFAKTSGIFLMKILIDLHPLKIFSLLGGALMLIGFYFGGKEIIEWIINEKMLNTGLIISGMMLIMTGIIIICNAILISIIKDK